MCDAGKWSGGYQEGEGKLGRGKEERGEVCYHDFTKYN